MTQRVHDYCVYMCNQCSKSSDKPCAWLSLGNEYCDEIMDIERYICGLETENEMIWRRYNEQYNQICNALNYVKNNSCKSEVNIYGIPEYLVFKGSVEELLQKLKGE